MLQKLAEGQTQLERQRHETPHAYARVAAQYPERSLVESLVVEWDGVVLMEIGNPLRLWTGERICTGKAIRLIQFLKSTSAVGQSLHSAFGDGREKAEL